MGVGPLDSLDPASRSGAQLERLTVAEQMLADIATAADAVHVIRFAEAARVWAQQATLGTSAVNHATVIKMRAERRLANAVDQGQQTGQIARPHVRSDARPPGITPIDEIVDTRRLAEARKIRDTYTDEDLAELRRRADDADEVLSRKDLITRPNGLLVVASGGSQDWYTPPEYVEAARTVLGGIDLDPASSAEANRTVRAARYLTEADDGLTRDWRGRVWMNPPYAAAGRFVAKLAGHLADGTVPAAIVLVSLHTMSASWFEPLYGGVLCISRGRLPFTRIDGYTGAPTFGSVFAYFGPAGRRFAGTFSPFGHILTETRKGQ